MPLASSGKSVAVLRPARAHQRGRFAVVTERWRGLRWTLWRQVLRHQAKRSQRTAKSCGPGAATLASIRPACAGLATVTIKAAHRGEHEVSRKAIARGKPGCPGCTCGLTRVHFCSTPTHTGLRAQSAPGFPCALFTERANEIAKTRAKARRGNAKSRLQAV